MPDVPETSHIKRAEDGYEQACKIALEEKQSNMLSEKNKEKMREIPGFNTDKKLRTEEMRASVTEQRRA